MENFNIIEDKKNWNNVLANLKNVDPCHSYTFHKIYQLHQKANSIRLLEYRFKNQFVIYPIIIFDVPKEISSENYKFATSAYGFTGHLIRGTKSFIDDAFHYINNWLVKEKIVAEFVRFSPFLNYEINLLQRYDYQISNNRIMAMWDSSISKNKNDNSQYSCNMSKRAKKAGVIFSEIKEDKLNLFQELYIKTMLINKADKFFFYSKNYFDKLYEFNNLYNNFVYGVFSKNKLVAAAWFIELNGLAVYHLGCNNRNIPGLSNLVLREAIKDLVINKDVKEINLTGGRTTDLKDKLLRFKSSIANSSKDFYVGKRSIMPKNYKKLIIKYNKLYAEKLSNKFIPWS